MNVSLTPELERLVQEKVESGLYGSQSEVVRDALRLLAEQDRRRQAHLQQLQGALAEGIAQADQGEVIDGAQAVERIGKRLRSRKKGRRTR